MSSPVKFLSTPANSERKRWRRGCLLGVSKLLLLGGINQVRITWKASSVFSTKPIYNNKNDFDIIPHYINLLRLASIKLYIAMRPHTPLSYI